MANESAKAIKKVKIKLPRKTGQADLFVAVNGEQYLIKRNEEVEVPWYIAEVIRNSEDADEERERRLEAEEVRQANLKYE